MHLRPLLFAATCAAVAGTTAFGATGDVMSDGVYGFPQASATVVCEMPTLRVSVWNDATYLFVQAVLPTDQSAELGETRDGRAIGDGSSLILDLDADGAVTPNVDRSYALNPWPSLPGLRYSVKLSGNASTGLKGDSAGRGSIAYVETANGARTRVDTYLIPLKEIGRGAGDEIRFALWAQSAKPKVCFNSVGFTRDGTYYPHHLPREKHHRYTIAEREASIDATRVPRGRDDTVTAARPPVGTKPAIGAVPPELVARTWLNSDGPLTFEALRGRVVVVEFWATWCGPCVKNIPHLRELHAAHEAEGLTVIGFTDQSARGIEAFVTENEMTYVIGAGSELSRTYGVSGIPHAFVIGRDGTVRWHGHPAKPEFDAAIKAALGETSG